MRIKTYIEDNLWEPEGRLIEFTTLEKEEVHERGLLHLSVHLLLEDEKRNLCLRLRSSKEQRYGGLFTTSIGTHVPHDEKSKTALQRNLPIDLDLIWKGEFRVKEHHENEICELYLGRVDKTNFPLSFLQGREFISSEGIDTLIRENKTTPHLVEAYRLWRKDA